MFRRFAAFTCLAVLTAWGGQVSAADFCQTPGPPPDQALQPVAPVKPDTPSCINPVTRISSCRPAVLKTFNANISDYNQAMIKFNADASGYIDALNHWARASVDYANCEIQRLNREVAQ